MLKRLFDICASCAGLVVLSPMLGIVSLLIKLDSPGPVLFRQKRVGRDGKAFDIYKFRTMRVDPSGAGPALTVRDDARITRIGTTLRRYKVDELPQLVNVFVGDMSLVGPRPELPKYVDRWDERTKSVLLSIRPGMTDLASIEFRNESALLEGSEDPEQKYLDEIAPAKGKLAVSYVQNQNIWLDMKILWKTIVAILR